MVTILDGRKIGKVILEDLAKEIKSRDLDLRLAVVSVGQNLVSEKYQQQKKTACEKIGVGFKRYGFPGKIEQAELEREIQNIGADKTVSGIIIQLPLSKHLSTNRILNLIPSAKDPDCLTFANFGRFCQGDYRVLPPVVGAVRQIFARQKIKVAGKNAVVVGAGRLVGLPVSVWLTREGATVTICNKSTKNQSDFTKKADIIISGVGQPNLIKGSIIKKGATVIDCGTSSEGGKTVGDVEFSSVIKKAGFLTPVPGGIGPLTIACLLENLVKLNKQ